MAIDIIKNKSGTVYRVRVRDSLNKWFPVKSFEKKSDADRYERDLLSQRDKGGRGGLSSATKMTLLEYWNVWSKECRQGVSEGWKISQDTIFRTQITPWIGRCKISDITSLDIGRLLSKEHDRGYSPQSITHIYNLLHRMFNDAIEHFEVLQHNPVKKRYRPKIPRKERNFFTPEESFHVLEVARTDRVGAAIWIAILGGLRPSEIQALRWESVDFSRMLIVIKSAFNRKIFRLQDHPKQSDWGFAPMNQLLADFLKPLSAGKSPQDFVCQGSGSSKCFVKGMMTYDMFENTLSRICQEAQVKRITPHELRHSCTEIYVQAGASQEDLRRLLNHKSLAATARYMHRTEERLQKIASNIQMPDSVLETRKQKLRVIK